MASNSSLDEIEKDECEVDDEDEEGEEEGEEGGEEGEEGVSTERVEEVRRLLDINRDDWDLYGGWAWGEVRWTVAPQSSSKKLQWQIDSTVLKGTQIQQKIEQHCRGKLSLTPSFILTVLVNKYRNYDENGKYRNYGRQITAPQYVKDQTATVMWDLMKIDMANTPSKTAVKNAAKTVYRNNRLLSFPNVSKLDIKEELVKQLKTMLNYPLDLEDGFYVWILFYTSNLQRKAIVRRNREARWHAQ